MNVLVVIDMQHDFVDGSLGSPEAQAIVDNVRQKLHPLMDLLFLHEILTILIILKAKKVSICQLCIV